MSANGGRRMGPTASGDPRDSPRRTTGAWAIGAAAVLAAALVAWAYLALGAASTPESLSALDAGWPADMGSPGDAADLERPTQVAEKPPTYHCASGILMQDDQQLPSGGSGEATFVLDEPCHLHGDGTIGRSTAADIRIRLEGPDGLVYAYHGTRVIAALGGSTGDERTDPGPHPAGTYRYSYEVEGDAAFHFEVRASP